MRKGKVLFIIHMPPPVHGASMMGQYIKDSSLINSAFDCYYINATIASSLEDVGHFRFNKIFGIISKNIEIARTIRKVKPEMVYFTPSAYGKPFYKDCLTMFLLKCYHCKIVTQYHNKGVSLRQSHRLDDALYRFFFNNIKVILLSDLLFNDFSKYVKKENLYICPNGIPATIPESSTGSKFNYGRFRILFLSNMIVEKGVWTLFEACKNMIEKGIDFECHYVGGWGDISEFEFKKAIKESNLEDCIIPHGPLYGADKESIIRQSDILVFPTYYSKECFPLVLLEAMKYGKACISTSEGAIPDVIADGVTGYIIPAKNSLELSEKIRFLIGNRDACNKMGDKGREKFNEFFTIDHYESRICEIIKDVESSNN